MPGAKPHQFLRPGSCSRPALRRYKKQSRALCWLRVILDVVFNHTAKAIWAGLPFAAGLITRYYRHAHGVLVNDTSCGLDTNSAPVWSSYAASMSLAERGRD
jgi:hypothetical protein